MQIFQTFVETRVPPLEFRLLLRREFRPYKQRTTTTLHPRRCPRPPRVREHQREHQREYQREHQRDHHREHLPSAVMTNKDFVSIHVGRPFLLLLPYFGTAYGYLFVNRKLQIQVHCIMNRHCTHAESTHLVLVEFVCVRSFMSSRHDAPLITQLPNNMVALISMVTLASANFTTGPSSPHQTTVPRDRSLDKTVDILCISMTGQCCWTCRILGASIFFRQMTIATVLCVKRHNWPLCLQCSVFYHQVHIRLCTYINDCCGRLLCSAPTSASSSHLPYII